MWSNTAAYVSVAFSPMAVISEPYDSGLLIIDKKNRPNWGLLSALLEYKILRIQTVVITLKITKRWELRSSSSCAFLHARPIFCFKSWSRCSKTLMLCFSLTLRHRWRYILDGGEWFNFTTQPVYLRTISPWYACIIVVIRSFIP